MVMQANLGLRRDEILEYIRSVVEVVVQLTRLPNGQRHVREVYFAHMPQEGAPAPARRTPPNPCSRRRGCKRRCSRWVAPPRRPPHGGCRGAFIMVLMVGFLLGLG